MNVGRSNAIGTFGLRVEEEFRRTAGMQTDCVALNYMWILSCINGDYSFVHSSDFRQFSEER